jgi:predicted flap endonuclease-1-like 5' DNA nuclease
MKIEDIEGIGPKFGELLRNQGITSPQKLLDQACTRKGRQALAEKAGIDDGRILKWVNLCDLCRISGISTQYSELLEAAGVDTVKELRNRNAENLAEKMKEINASKKLVRQTPSLKSVLSWVDQAKKMDPKVSY